MAMKILIFVAPAQAPFQLGIPGAEASDLNRFSTILQDSANERTLLLAPAGERAGGALLAPLLAAKTAGTVAYLSRPEDSAHAQEFLTKLSAGHGAGVKVVLEKGSTVFSEAFFQAGAVGTKLDSVFRFARDRLSSSTALDAWATLQSLVFNGLRNLPGQGEAGTGERVDVQLGADEKHLACSVRFDLAEDKFRALLESPLLALPRTATQFMEVRYLRDAKKAEILCVYSRAEGVPTGCVDSVTIEASAKMETQEDARDYQFQTFGSVTGSEPTEKRVIKGGGFKKKFSEKMKPKSGAAPAAADPATATAEQIVDADAGNFLVKGEVLQPAAKIVVSGDASLAKNAETEKVWESRFKTMQEEIGKKDGLLTELRAELAKAASGGGGGPAEKGTSLLESKIQGLEATLKQREELVAKLNKEIADIKDPSKMGVISGIKDNQVEGLKANIARVQAELAESQGREKELLGVVDKAISMKDEAVKRFKELDTKLRQSQGGNNSKSVMLEKQLEEQKRQNTALSKRITQLTEQIQATGKRVA